MRYYTDKIYKTTDFLKDIQEPDNAEYGQLDGQWNVNFGNQEFGDQNYLEHDKFFIEVLHDIASLQNTQKLHWYETSDLRHYIESAQKYYTKDSLYVQRDKITAAAIMIGLPVKLDTENKENNKIGLYLSRATLRKFKWEWLKKHKSIKK